MKKSLVNIGRALALLAVLCLVLTCSSDGSSSTGRDPSHITIHNPRAMFVANQSQNTGKAVNVQSALFEVLNDGTARVVSFQDEYGNQVTCDVKKVLPLSDSYVGICYYYEGKSCAVIAELATGKLLDFSAYQLESAQVFGDTLVVPDNSLTLWRINIPSRTAVAANNPAYLPIRVYGGIFRTTYGAYDGVNNQSTFLVDSNLNILAVKSSGNPEQRLLFADGSVPFAPGQSTGSLTYGDVPYNAGYMTLFNGPDGSLYFIWWDQGSSRDNILSKLTFDRDGVHTDKHPIASASQWVLTHRNTYSFQTYSRYIPCLSGYIKTYKDGTGNLKCDYVPRSMPSLPSVSGQDPHEYALVSGDYLYWRENDTIKRFQFSPSSSSTGESMVSDPDLIWFEVANGVVFFAKYLGSTAVGTYRVDSPGATPVLVQSSDMAIVSIVEL